MDDFKHINKKKVWHSLTNHNGQEEIDISDRNENLHNLLTKGWNPHVKLHSDSCCVQSLCPVTSLSALVNVKSWGANCMAYNQLSNHEDSHYN